MTEGGTYVILFSYTFLNLCCQKINLRYYHSFLRSMRDDFLYACTDGQRYRKRFFKSQLVTWKLCVLCFLLFISAIVLVGIGCTMLIVYLMNRVPDDPNDKGRPLLFPVWWFDTDVSATPYFEFFFTYTNYTILMIGYVYCYMTQTQLVWVRQITTKCDLIIYAIEDLMEDIQPTSDPEELERYNGLIKKRFGTIIKQHHAMLRLLEDFAGVYKKLLMYEQKLGGPVICFTVYAMTEKWANDGQLHPVLIILSVSVFVVCIIPSYMCTILGEKIRSISDACLYMPFWNASKVVRPYLVLLMQRSLRSLPLQAPGFEDVSLQTFSSNMAAAYSMFNMLRQTNLGSTLN
ncbi:uncharacterized protein LOC126369794 [Pectinophora gossypiella]|uniref:uncharacterized protein LOC126369794 n=1 Tax=Pectinophora gossypiella TaxID=13191 RepID=UPI00214F4AF1|nr:uncharacterized protein LOC126369794 [Pectinophora gossypiella]